MNALPRNQILQGDCLTLMRVLPDACIDVVFADPPYNLQLRQDLHRPDASAVSAVDEEWDRFDSFKAYDDFSRAWLAEVQRVLKPSGTIWVIGTYHNIFRLGTLCQDLGFWILNDIIWRKTNPMPNFRGTRFTNAHETLIWAGREKSGYKFNYQAMKSLNEDLQMRSDWFLPICTGAERLKDETGRRCHPTQKPESLLYRLLLASSDVGDMVLDPFFGTGTTGVVAKKLGRDFIGIEREEAYCQDAQARLDATHPYDKEDLAVAPAPQRKPRVPFGSLVEQGALKPGTRLFSQARRYQARVRADGSLRAEGEDLVGSIHKLGAMVQGTPSCNGWTFWHFEQDEELVPIDAIRQKMRD